ncbi:TDE2712 family protein [Tissierella creatinophila]|uniref:Uncharacterized protein n=1 Tax=Tissierella creatinophila DSM 6911 TaxID=1123403 RepID=A0A1U7M8I0_TISCR|nr:hypothetical protein [Tissierella creatinophila]OLS03633.1 hypothetical protein TICRE_03290 [Tissierella creatinophila DSM 6911]
MVKTITVNLDVVEMMLFYWQSIRDRQKVSDAFMIEVAEKEDMKYLYNDNFKEESVRKVLSAISNREKVNHPTKEESRFWSHNMWMLEDLDNMNNMVRPIKVLNLDYLKEDLESNFEKLEVVFIPGHLEEYYIDGNKLIINFFNIMVDSMDETKVNLAGKPIEKYVEEKLKELR